MQAQLKQAEHTLREFGLSYWADKFAEIGESNDSITLKAERVMKLYGGFGTISDNAFSDEDAPEGMTGEEATKLYLKVMNALYRAAKQVSE